LVVSFNSVFVKFKLRRFERKSRKKKRKEKREKRKGEMVTKNVREIESGSQRREK